MIKIKRTGTTVELPEEGTLMVYRRTYGNTDCVALQPATAEDLASAGYVPRPADEVFTKDVSNAIELLVKAQPSAMGRSLTERIQLLLQELTTLKERDQDFIADRERLRCSWCQKDPYDHEGEESVLTEEGLILCSECSRERAMGANFTKAAWKQAVADAALSEEKLTSQIATFEKMLFENNELRAQLTLWEKWARRLTQAGEHVSGHILRNWLDELFEKDKKANLQWHKFAQQLLLHECPNSPHMMREKLREKWNEAKATITRMKLQIPPPPVPPEGLAEETLEPYAKEAYECAYKQAELRYGFIAPFCRWEDTPYVQRDKWCAAVAPLVSRIGLLRGALANLHKESEGLLKQIDSSTMYAGLEAASMLAKKRLAEVPYTKEMEHNDKG